MDRIIVKNISKKFKISFKKRQSTLSRFLSLFSGRGPRKTIFALKNISFNIKEGEIVGIIGDNGSGKSTLLRAISRIYEIDKGDIKTKGKIIPLITLNIGLQLRLSMKDNIYLIGSLFGLSRKKIKKRFNSIIKFAELEDFTDTKLYQFSEGMKQRLTFSIAIHSDPEILLLDEVFEVGDDSFRKKSSAKIKEFVKNKASVILVTHRLEMIKRHCNRVIWIDKGEIVNEGDVQKVLKAYQKNDNKPQI